MSTLASADDWVNDFEKNRDDYKNAVAAAQEKILEALAGEPIAVHQVSSRLKTASSVRGKLRSKRYDDPERQMTDILGVRIITVYEHGVAATVEAIRNNFRIDEPNSVDKTSKLGADRFGYRGIHLIARVQTGAIDASGEILDRSVVEIQVRSVIEHAWAEIEHELRYKSGLPFSEELNRRFNAVAGTLEMVDREFTSIVGELVHGVDQLTSQLPQIDADTPLDARGLLAVLQRRRPDAPKAGPGGLKLPLRSAANFVSLLQKEEIASIGQFDDAIQDQKVRNAVHDYALSRRIVASAVSAAAALAILIGIRNFPMLQETELAGDALLLAAIRGVRTET